MKYQPLSHSSPTVVARCGERAFAGSGWLIESPARARTATAHDLVKSIATVGAARTLKSTFA